MATITRHGPLRHLRAEPNQHVLHFSNGKLSRSGAGLAYWFLPLSAAMAQVPVEDCQTTFVLNERSADFQALSVQVSVTYRVLDPSRACARVNFSIDVNTGLWVQRPLETLATFWLQRSVPTARSHIAQLALQDALRRGSDSIRQALVAHLGQDAEIPNMGLQLVGLVIDHVVPAAEVEKALQTPAREAIQAKADEAIFQRRALAVEKERAIKENELATELELERKQEQLIKSRGENALAQVRQNATAEQEKTAAEVSRSELYARGQAERRTIEATAEAEATRLLAAAKLEELRAQHEVWQNTPKNAAMALVLSRFAEHLQTIGHLNITPDLLGAQVRDFFSGNNPGS